MKYLELVEHLNAVTKSLRATYRGAFPSSSARLGRDYDNQPAWERKLAAGVHKLEEGIVKLKNVSTSVEPDEVEIVCEIVLKEPGEN